MFEIIGVLSVWVAGAAAAFYAPILISGWWGKTGDGLADLMIGLFIGILSLAVYLIVTMTYFAAT